MPQMYSLMKNCESGDPPMPLRRRWQALVVPSCVFALLINNITFIFLGSRIGVNIWESTFGDPPNAIFTHNNVWFADGPKNYAPTRTVEIKHPSKHGLAGGWPLPSLEFPDREAYGVSAFHQLHCVSALRREIASLETGFHQVRKGIEVSFGEIRDAGHTDHCINLLVQSVKCTGDLTLTPVKVVNGTLINDFDAYGAPRRCYDWAKVHELAVEYSADHFFSQY